MIKRGTIADLIHDSKMLRGFDYDKTIPSLSGIQLKIDQSEYDEIVQVLISVPMEKPYQI